MVKSTYLQFANVFIFFVTSLAVFSQVPEIVDNKLVTQVNSIERFESVSGSSLNSLIEELQPTIYVKEAVMKRTNDELAPIRVITDVASINLLYSANSLYQSVQLICIKIENANELKSKIRISELKGFSNLKYVYFLCSYLICGEQQGINACEEEKIAGMVSDIVNPAIKIIYTSTSIE